MPIKQGLLIHSPKRYYVNLKVSVKHGLTTHKLFYKKKRTIRKIKEFQCQNPKDVRDLTYAFNNIKREKSGLLKFTSKFACLRKLNLQLETTEATSKSTLTFLKKLLRQNKRLTSVNITLCKRGRDSTFVLTPLRLLRHLKCLEVRLQYHSESIIEKFERFLSSMYMKQNWPRLKSQTVTLDTGFTGINIENDIATAANALTKLGEATNNKPTHFNLLFYFRRNPDHVAFEVLADALKSLSNIKSLALVGQVNIDFSSLLRAVQDSKHLKEMTVYISNEIQASTTLETIPNTLGQIQSLTNLKLHFLDIGDINQFNYFAQNLRAFNQLTALSLTFLRTSLLNDNSFILLGQSLSTLTGIKDLHISCKKQSRNTNLGNNGIESVFKAISCLTKLKSTTLNFSGYGAQISDKTVMPLFASLNGLPNLQYLSLNLSLNRIGDDSLCVLRKVMPNMKRIKSLILEFEQCVWLSSRAISKFVSSLKQLKTLSYLTFKFMTSMIDVPLALNLVSVLYNLKGLRALEVRLFRWNEAYDDGVLPLLNAMKHLEGRVRVDFKCPLYVLLPRII